MILSFLWFFFASLSQALLHSVKPTEMHENWDKKKTKKKHISHYPVCIFIPTDLLFGSSRADKWCAWTSCPASRKTARKIWCKNFFGFLCWPSTPLSRAVTKKGLGTRGQGFPLATISITPGYILRKLEKSKVEPLLSGHPRGTS